MSRSIGNVTQAFGLRRSVAFLAFFLSGASSLIFQSIWSRMLHHVFGATSVAISSVITVFMAGLGLGAWLAGRYADRIKHPIITYAIAEIGVGLWALVVPWLVDSEGWLASVNSMLRVSLGAESFGFMVARFLCVVPILLIPTTLMGSTLPLLSRHFVEAEQRAGGASSKVGVLYAVNTFGAVAGTFLAGFVLLPNVGLAYTNFAALSMNFGLAALIFLFRKTLLEGQWKPGEKLEWKPRPVAAPSGEAAIDKKADKKPRAVEALDEEESAIPIPPIARKAAFLAFAASGAAALCYEVVWTRALAMTIGSSIYSFTLILMTFLVGIAGGSAVASALLGRSGSRNIVIAIASAVLALLATSSQLAQNGVGAWIASWAACLLPIGVIAGMVYLRGQNSDEGARESGAAESPVPSLMMIAVPALASVINAVALNDATIADAANALPRIVAAVVTVLAAFLAILVAVRRYHVLLLALVQLFIAVATLVNYVFQDEIPYAFARLVSSIEDLPSHVGTVQFFMFLVAGLCTLPATVGMGAMFPLTVRVWTAGGKDVGRDVSVVYTGNTVGSIIGAWLPGFVLMPLIGIERTLQVGIVLNLLLALMMLIASAAEPEETAAIAEDDAQPKPNKKKGAREPLEAKKRSEVPLWHAVTIYVLAPLIPALVALLWIGTKERDSMLSWDRSRMTLGVFRVSLAADVLNPEAWGSPDILYYRDGLSTTVSVEKWGRHFALKNNGKVDASNGDDMPTQIMVAGFPLVMHPNGPQDLDVAVIGFGSGTTLGAALEFPIRSIDVIELERSIPDASRFFEDVNHLEYPLEEFPYVQRDRLTVINDDGRNYLASTDKMYDVIMSEPSNPWITGVSDLFTTDHFRITKKRLRPGGIYCQWVQLYEISPENIKTIYRTFASQFRHVLVFAAEDLSSDTVLLGSDSPLPLDLDRASRAFANPAIATELERAYIHSPYDIFSRTLLASRDEVMQFTQTEYRLRGGEWVPEPTAMNGEQTECSPATCRREPARLNTDDNALIEFSAPRDLIGFQRYEGYLANIYSPDWPYGRLLANIRGFGSGDEGARHHAEMAMALIASGRKVEAAEFIARAEQLGHADETRVAVQVLTLLMEGRNEPRVPIEPPVPGPQMDEETARRLMEGFDLVRAAVDQGQYGGALAAMEELPSPLRMHSGPGMRLLYGYLLYKAAEDMPSRYSEAIDELEELVRSDEEYVRRHPQIYYFLARAHDADFNYDKALRNMRLYVESGLTPGQGAESGDLPEPPLGTAPTTDEPGESAKDEHEDRT